MSRKFTLPGEQAKCTDAIDSNWTNLSAALGGYIYAIGGFLAGDNGPTERYDPKTDNWTRLRLADLGFRFSYGAVTVFDGQIWACGRTAPSRDCHTLDTSKNSWVRVSTMKENRSVILNSKSRPLRNSIDSCSVFRTGFCMATLNDKLYAIGGGGTKSIEFFDANNREAGWQLYSQASFPVERIGISCVTVGTPKGTFCYQLLVLMILPRPTR